MNYQVKYSGSFYSRKGVLYTAEILEQADDTLTVEELSFAGEEPLIIERQEKGKEEPIQSSTATLKIISPGDRTYQNLYTVTPGAIALRILRNRALWWMGCLDPEFYEEPYISAGDYEVSLTFSDFGIFKRLKMKTGGSIRDMLVTVLSASGLSPLEIDTNLITTTLTDGTSVIDGLSVERKNWTDEDGEDCSMEDALSSILQALSLRIIQRAGKIYVYDLNGLYTLGATRLINWMSDDQIMGVDKVVNKVKVTFSPYCEAKVSTDMAYTDTPHANAIREIDGFPAFGFNWNLVVPNYEEGKLYFTYWNSDNPNQPTTLKSYHSFTMYLGRKGIGIGITSLDERCYLYHIEPIYDGSESSGVVISCPFIGARPGDGVHTDATKWYAETFLHAINGITRPCWMLDYPYLITFHDIPIQPLYTAEAQKLRLRLNMSLLLSTRYNPFVDPGDGYANGLNNNTNDSDVIMACLEINVTALDSAGNATQIFNGPFLRHEKDINGSCKGWENYSELTSVDNAHLTFYNSSDKDGSIMNEWIGCRQPSSCWYEERNKAMSLLDDGMYIDYPASTDVSKVVAIRVKIRPGCMIFKKGFSQAADDLNHLATAENTTQCDHFNVKWMLLKDFGVTVVSSKEKMAELKSDDVTYYGYANEKAADDLELNTTCGTLENAVVTSKGTFRKSSDGSFVTALTRAGRTDTAEQLLIGTLQSQFCDRRTKLSGTEEETGEGLKAITEAAQGDKKFIVLSETIDVNQDLNSLSMAELRPDEHELDSETEES